MPTPLKFVIEFYKPGAANAAARWDFPIRYDGADIDQIWIDTDFLKGSVAKAARPPAGCIYRVLLVPRIGARDLPDIAYTKFLGLSGLTAREAGTVIGTPDIMASATYSDDHDRRSVRGISAAPRTQRD